MAEDGYLLLRGALDREIVLNARRELLTKLAVVGEVEPSFPLEEAVDSGTADWSPEFVNNLRTGAAVRALSHQGCIIAFFEHFLGGAVRSFDHIWVRRVKPGGA